MIWCCSEERTPAAATAPRALTAAFLGDLFPGRIRFLPDRTRPPNRPDGGGQEAVSLPISSIACDGERSRYGWLNKLSGSVSDTSLL